MAGAGGVVAGFEAVGPGEEGFDAADDFFLFFEGWERNLQSSHIANIDTSDCYPTNGFLHPSLDAI